MRRGRSDGELGLRHTIGRRRIYVCYRRRKANTDSAHVLAPSVVMWAQREIRLQPRERGFHVITHEVLDALPEIAHVDVGLLHVFIRHTSASLTLNENVSADVRRDFESHFNAAVPEDARYWTHTLEGADDMPAHVKASLLGASVTIPIAGGRPALGTWQGIYLCEHRNDGGRRSLIATLTGETGEPG